MCVTRECFKSKNIYEGSSYLYQPSFTFLCFFGANYQAITDNRWILRVLRWGSKCLSFVAFCHTYFETKYGRCYNPSTNYKVLADGSTRWLIDRGSWPTGQNKRVGLGELVSPLISGVDLSANRSFSRPIHNDKNTWPHPPRAFHEISSASFGANCRHDQRNKMKDIPLSTCMYNTHNKHIATHIRPSTSEKKISITICMSSQTPDPLAALPDSST